MASTIHSLSRKGKRFGQGAAEPLSRPLPLKEGMAPEKRRLKTGAIVTKTHQYEAGAPFRRLWLSHLPLPKRPKPEQTRLRAHVNGLHALNRTRAAR
jgi:hypothetical protein